MTDWKPTHRRKTNGMPVGAYYRDGLWHIESPLGRYDTLGPKAFSEWYEPIPPPPMPEPLAVNGVKLVECYIEKQGIRSVWISCNRWDPESAAALLAWLPGAVEWQRGAE